jgi:hypothetical protein
MWNLAVFSFRFTPQTGSLGMVFLFLIDFVIVFKIVVVVVSVCFLTDEFI